MKIKQKIILTTLAVAVFAFLTGMKIWPMPMDAPVPTSQQLPFFIILSVFEAVSFGLGISFLIFGWPLVQKFVGRADTLSKLAFASIAWYMVNWWPHDHLHMQNGMNLQGLLYIEYGFHVTMIIAASILAVFFWTRVLKAKLP